MNFQKKLHGFMNGSRKKIYHKIRKDNNFQANLWPDFFVSQVSPSSMSVHCGLSSAGGSSGNTVTVWFYSMHEYMFTLTV